MQASLSLCLATQAKASGHATIGSLHSPTMSIMAQTVFSTLLLTMANFINEHFFLSLNQ